MSDALAELFDAAAHLQESDDARWLQDLVRKEVKAASAAEQQRHRNDHSSTPTDCRLGDIGKFLVRATTLLSKVADGVTEGRHISAYTKSRLEELKFQNDLSELNPLYDLEEKHQSLRAIASRLRKTSADVAQILQGTSHHLTSVADDNKSFSIPQRSAPEANKNYFGALDMATLRMQQPSTNDPFHQGSTWRDSMDGDTNSHRASHLRGQSMDFSARDAETANSESAELEINDETAVELQKRGKGTHICPQWRSCNKGGNKDGRPFIFERNSAFKYVSP
ncbi:hypothetical protein LTS15_006662 [Exophiala xenobiotica]|nr:hypothetical protein LTS15_006662 [Exophiala xenobiotica]